ncbi:sulfotransferase family 2 domain-containing protein [Roseibium sp. LAB1]
MDEYQLKNFLKFAPARLGLVPKKFLFIHIPKNGGMSIRHSKELEGNLVLANRRRLKSKAYADAVKRKMAELGAMPGYEHARYRDVDLSVRKATKAFAIVRNPWSRTVSRFKFALQTRQPTGAPIEFSPKAFEAFLEERHLWAGVDYFWHRAIRGWYQQEDYLIDEQNKITLDIMRQEHLEKDLKSYLGMKTELQARNVSNATSKDYRQIYSNHTISIVADWYAADIERFGFDFDTAATKNVSAFS